MIKEIVHDPIILSGVSEPADQNDMDTAKDLMDTLKAHKDDCVGMAANMIGVRKKIIAFDNDDEYMLMFNPEIIKSSDPFETAESCLSWLGGPRNTKRYRSIKVRYQNEAFQTRLKTFKGWTAQIIQHEIDHFSGIQI